MGKFGDFIFKHAHGTDAAETEKTQREKYPLLLHKDEKILLSWKDRGGSGRDKHMFTTHRILLKDGKGVTGKRKNYKSVPYSSIQAFETETAGSFDGDVELRVYSKGIDKISIQFSADVVDIFEIQQFLNVKLCEFSLAGTQDEVDGTPPKLDDKDKKQGFFDWIGDNALQKDPKEVETILKTTYPVLLEHESVQIAFKSGRDMMVFTNMRCMKVDVKGMSGKRVAFLTVLWKSILAYSVETAGAFFDRDMEIKLYTKIRTIGKIEQDLRHGKCDLFQLQKVLCNHILGEDTKPMEGLDTHEGEVDQKGFWWFRDNQRPLDTVEMNRVYHSNPRILRGNEVVEMAFKGHRDVTIFTNLRVLIIDPQGITGTSIEYFSLPWKSITAHGVRTAGKYLDWDSEVMFWTEMDFYPGEAGSDDSPPIPPRPEMSYFELDFNKNKVDMNVLNWYLSHRLIISREQMEIGAPIPTELMTTNFDPPGFGLEGMIQLIGGDQREIDPKALDEQLHGATKMLMDDEHVLMAFKAGRDTSAFTNYRVILIDVQGITGHKVEYTSIPFKAIRAWSCETAGVWDTDTELTLYTKNRWHLCKTHMDFRTGKADIQQINKFLGALIIGVPTDSKVDFNSYNLKSGQREAKPIEGGSFGILNNCWKIDAGEIEKKLRSDPDILLKEEKVCWAFQSGRDVHVYTNRRYISIDTKGLSGKRVKYKSIPFHQVQGYEFETAGSMDRDAEIYLHTEIPKVWSMGPPRSVGGLNAKLCLLVKDVDIYEIGAFCNDHILFEENKYAEEPEVAM